MMPKQYAGETCTYCGSTGPVAQAPHCLPAGTVLHGRYMLGDVIGQGGFGITYIGLDTVLNVRVCVKEYFPKRVVQRDTRTSTKIAAKTASAAQQLNEGKTRFLEEARATAHLNGIEGVVDVHDFFEENGTTYIVMEYIEGVDLRHWLNNGRISADQTFELMAPIMDALEKVHAAGIIHRDISPDNIMLTSEGKLKLTDFGAARAMMQERGEVTVMLKEGYAPQEQYDHTGASLGPWTDIYALCATMYRCITGVTPPSAAQRAVADTIVWPSQMGIEITERQEQALMFGMALNSANRFQSIAALKAFIGTNKGFSSKKIIALVSSIAAVLIVAVIGVGVAFTLNTPAPSDDQAVITEVTEESEETDYSSQSERSGSVSNVGNINSGTSKESSYSDTDAQSEYDELCSLLSQANTYDTKISACAADFNNLSLTESKDSRQTAANTASALSSDIKSTVTQVRNAEPSDRILYPENYENWELLCEAYDCLQNRIDVICQAWTISLKYDKPAEHEAEIDAPLKAQKDSTGNNKYYTRYKEIYPTIKFVKP